MYGGFYNRHAPSNSTMIPFPRILRRKFGILIQAVLLFLAAFTLIAGFRRFSSNNQIAVNPKFSDKQSFSPNVPTKTTFSTSSRLLESVSIESKPVLETTSHKSSLILETTLSKSTTILKTSSLKSTSIPTSSLKPAISMPETIPAQSSLLLNDVNATLLERASVYVKAIMTPEDDHFPRLSCPSPNSTRYDYLRHTDSNRDLKYFFALDMHRRAKILPRLIGSIVETIRFLGPEKCALSIIKGSWDDGTSIILKLLREELEGIGVTYFVNSSDIAQGVSEPLSMRRSLALESLIKHPDRFSTNVTMNMALEPLMKSPDRYSPNATVVFLNNAAICMEDILELIHQRLHQKADMTCPMDWTFDQGQEIEPTFHDVWVTRGMTGDSFFNIPIENGTWEYASHLLWNDPQAQARFYAHEPFQVFSCWSGVTVFTAKPFLEQKIKFRSPTGGECVQGEAQLFCKDMWYLGHGKIATVPSVSVEYSNEGATKLKALKGYVSHWVSANGKEMNNQSMLIEWEEVPPVLTKCYQGPWANQTWVQWDERLPEAAIESGAHGIAGSYEKASTERGGKEDLSKEEDQEDLSEQESGGDLSQDEIDPKEEETLSPDQ